MARAAAEAEVMLIPAGRLGSILSMCSQLHEVNTRPSSANRRRTCNVLVAFNNGPTNEMPARETVFPRVEFEPARSFFKYSILFAFGIYNHPCPAWGGAVLFFHGDSVERNSS